MDFGFCSVCGKTNLVSYASGSKRHLDTCLAHIAHSNKFAELTCGHLHVEACFILLIPYLHIKDALCGEVGNRETFMSIAACTGTTASMVCSTLSQHWLAGSNHHGYVKDTCVPAHLSDIVAASL